MKGPARGSPPDRGLRRAPTPPARRPWATSHGRPVSGPPSGRSSCIRTGAPAAAGRGDRQGRAGVGGHRGVAGVAGPLQCGQHAGDRRRPASAQAAAACTSGASRGSSSAAVSASASARQARHHRTQAGAQRRVARLPAAAHRRLEQTRGHVQGTGAGGGERVGGQLALGASALQRGDQRGQRGPGGARACGSRGGQRGDQPLQGGDPRGRRSLSHHGGQGRNVRLRGQRGQRRPDRRLQSRQPGPRGQQRGHRTRRLQLPDRGDRLPPHLRGGIVQRPQQP